MCTDNFEIALNAFDSVLDGISTCRIPSDEYVWTTTTTYPIKHDKDGETTICTNKFNSSSNILDDIERVIFNEPATVIIFKDGSKVQVKACSKDPFSKENGIRNALLKRAFANDIDENGYMTSRGLGERIEKILREKSVDQKEVAERKAKEKAEKNAKKKAEAKKVTDPKKTTKTTAKKSSSKKTEK